jgi:hypothetical protein
MHRENGVQLLDVFMRKKCKKVSFIFCSLLGELYRLRKDDPKPLEPDLINVSVGKQPAWPASSVKNCL